MSTKFRQRVCREGHDDWKTIHKSDGVTERRCRTCDNAYHRAWRKKDKAANPEKYAEYRRRHRASIRRRFGKSKRPPKDYVELFAKQKGVCAICLKPERKVQRHTADRLVIDHDHKTGKVRGLLCWRCNAALGWFNDDPKMFDRAWRYLGEG